MLFFELFPAVFAIVALIVAVSLFAVNHRARTDPHDHEPPRTPSQPAVAGDTPPPSGTARRPSMRA